jgi:hypothetical protein
MVRSLKPRPSQIVEMMHKQNITADTDRNPSREGCWQVDRPLSYCSGGVRCDANDLVNTPFALPGLV